MNILFIAYNFTPYKGGVQRVTDLLSKEFQRRGHKVYFLCGKNDTGEDRDLSAPVFFMDKPLCKHFDSNSVKYYHSLLLRLEIDVIINQYPIRRKSDFFLKKSLLGIKKISFYHGRPLGNVLYMNSDNNGSGKWLKNLYRLLVSNFKFEFWKFRIREIVSKSDFLCFLSLAYVDEVINKCGIKDDNKLIAIGNPLPFAISQNKLVKKDNVILFVGRINDPVKNLGDFIKVWQCLYADNSDWKAEIIGDDSGCDSYKKLIKDNGIDHIEFLGYQKEMKSYYQRAKIICMTSHHEGFPLVLLEAMSFGVVPCSYTTFATAYDLIDNNINGVLCTPYDILEMAKKIQNLIKDETLLEKMSISSVDKSRRYSIDIIGDKWEKLFVKGYE